jgi:uncharacterized protein
MQNINTSNRKTKIITLIVTCLTFLGSAFIISNTGFTIKNTGVSSNGGAMNTISVSGNGRVYAKPDMINIRFTITETKASSQRALDEVNTKIDQALKILKDAKISDDDISTSSLSIYPEYDYARDGRNLIGQRASQSINAKIKNISDETTKATQIIDNLSTIDNIQLNNINFDIEDKEKFYSQARKLAFEKAEQKAKELAKLGKVRLNKPVSIIDNSFDIAPPRPMTNMAEMTNFSKERSSTSLPSGELTITANIQVMWGIE